MKKVAIFDIDGTVFRSSLLIELVDSLIVAGIFPKEASKEYSKEYNAWLNREGTYDEYIMAVVAVFLKNIIGVHYGLFKNVAENVIKKQNRHVYRYTRDLIGSLKDEGYFILAISQSPKTILDSFCTAVGFDKVYGRMYELDEDNNFTGEIINLEEIQNKANILKRAVSKEGLTLEDSVGVGDSEDDVAFLELVTTPICFNPSKRLYDEALKRKWNIVVERKNVIYEI